MNVLIIGFGSIARKHLIALRSLGGDFVFYALRSNPNSPTIDDVINIYSLEDSSVKFDFAIISNPTNFHYAFIDQLAEMGTPVFIEKPPLASLTNAKDLADKIDKLQIKTYVACNMRFHPCIQFLKHYIDSNPNKRINELNIYCGSYLPDWRPNQDFRKNYSANKDMGGGVHLDLFHELDYTYWIFGRPTEVFCTKRSTSTLEIDAIDYANYILAYPKYTVSIILNYYRKDPKRLIEIVFEDQTWTIDLLLNRIMNNDEAVIFNSTEFNITQTYLHQMQSFISYLNSNDASINSFSESLEVLKICLQND